LTSRPSNTSPGTRLIRNHWEAVGKPDCRQASSPPFSTTAWRKL
jgi:hypothetical protein